MQVVDVVRLHLGQRLRSTPLKDTAMMSLQLFILRAVEDIAAAAKQKNSNKSKPSSSSGGGKKKKNQTDRLWIAQEVYATLVEAIRLETTPLQFATLFIEVGRQIEPSCFPYLFPLPPAPNNNNKQRRLQQQQQRQANTTTI